MKKIAIIGSGISGTSAAFYLNKLGYEVTLFESGSYFGGHTNTIKVEVEGKDFPIDTGFLVHNNRTYPNLIDFFNELNIKTHLSEMTFSVANRMQNIVWAGTNLFTLFVQKKNFFSFRFYSFIFEVLRFNRNAESYLIECRANINFTLGELLTKYQYSDKFKDWYLLPMGGSIWSTPTQLMLDFPAYTFLHFCMNHGLLQITNRPQWKTIAGGCNIYVDKALSTISNKYLNEPVLEVESINNKVKVLTRNHANLFDRCIFCTHPPEALQILKGIDNETTQCLSKFNYQKNLAVVHSDENVLPKYKNAWAAWNYLTTKSDSGNSAVSVSYLINKLQPLPFKKQIIVTLNPAIKIDKDKIYREIQYEHPLFTSEAIQAQSGIKNIQGRNNIYFSGAWMRYGFHEDGILSTKLMINKLLQDDQRDSDLVKIL